MRECILGILIIIFSVNKHLIRTHEDAIAFYNHKLAGYVRESKNEALEMVMKEMEMIK